MSLAKTKLHPPKPQLTESEAIELAEMFGLMADPTRLRIILACLSGPVCVSDIAEQIGMSGSLVSHHLRLLRAARILKGRRQGKQIFYSLLDDHIRCVLDDMIDHLGEPQDDLEDA